MLGGDEEPVEDLDVPENEAEDVKGGTLGMIKGESN